MPERLGGRFPPLLVELAVGAGLALLFVGLRLAAIPLAGDRAPYAFAFLAVLLSTLLAGWRSGVISLVASQLLTWFLLVRPRGGGVVPGDESFYALLIASLSVGCLLVILALYQREITIAWGERGRRIDFLAQALREIDHRTHNNFQTVLALVQLQARRSDNPEVRAALEQVVDRVKAVSLASEKLALASDDIALIRLNDHLSELCNQIRSGLVRDGVALECDLAECAVPADRAVCIAIIVNELVTNALKHAFAHEEGRILVATRLDDQGLVLSVADDGCGMDGAGKPDPGLGSRLVATFVRQLGARHDVTSSSDGTTHTIRVPALA